MAKLRGCLKEDSLVIMSRSSLSPALRDKYLIQHPILRNCSLLGMAKENSNDSFSWEYSGALLINPGRS